MFFLLATVCILYTYSGLVSNFVKTLLSEIGILDGITGGVPSLSWRHSWLPYILPLGMGSFLPLHELYFFVKSSFYVIIFSFTVTINKQSWRVSMLMQQVSRLSSHLETRSGSL